MLLSTLDSLRSGMVPLMRMFRRKSLRRKHKQHNALQIRSPHFSIRQSELSSIQGTQERQSTKPRSLGAHVYVRYGVYGSADSLAGLRVVCALVVLWRWQMCSRHMSLRAKLVLGCVCGCRYEWSRMFALAFLCALLGSCAFTRTCEAKTVTEGSRLRNVMHY
eukprot:6212002-Pleurochrysis_carterae.AAC.1